MDHKQQEQIALHRWAVIAEAAERPADRRRSGARWSARSPRAPTPTRTGRRAATRGARSTAGSGPGAAGGLEALKPSPRADTGTVRAHPELFAEAAALRLELPGRSAAQIASILYHRHGVRVAERTVRAQLRRAGLHREALAAEPKAYGRYEAGPPERAVDHRRAGRPVGALAPTGGLGAGPAVPDRR